MSKQQPPVMYVAREWQCVVYYKDPTSDAFLAWYRDYFSKQNRVISADFRFDEVEKDGWRFLQVTAYNPCIPISVLEQLFGGYMASERSPAPPSTTPSPEDAAKASTDALAKLYQFKRRQFDEDTGDDDPSDSSTPPPTDNGGGGAA